MPAGCTLPGLSCVYDGVMNDHPQIQQRPCDPTQTGLHLNPLLNRLYAARGLKTAADADLGLQKLLPLDSLGNLDAAVALISHAIDNNSRIVVVGDFDCDGATGTALAVRGLMMLGAQNVLFKVPHRVLHGYGLTPGLVDELAQLKPDLVITVDSGIACLPGIAKAKQLGYQVIVTDHHLPGDALPEADAIVNPNLPDDGFASKALAGVGVMFYLLLAVRQALRKSGSPGADADLSGLLDLVAIGTVADMVKLDANNRRLVRAGLVRINQGRCQPGVKALAQISGLALGKITETDIGFRIAPKINAAGRLEDMALGIECLLADDFGQALDMAESLHSINLQRQELQQDMLDQAEQVLAEANAVAVASEKRARILFGSSWHPGIVGLVASKMKDLWHRPVLVFAPSEPGSGELRGSARSIPGFHIRDALAHVDALHPGLITRFGGHAMAAGLTLAQENLARFSAAFESVASAWISQEDLQSVFWTDGPLQLHEFNRETALAIRAAGPWGQGFAYPLFDNEFDVLSWQVLKEKHLKLQLQLASPDAIGFISAIHFNGYRGEPLPKRLRAVFELQTNDFRDRLDFQCLIRHMEPC